ncbi:hypothetical protein E3N88_19941 [Mikania micrantha]|uniref:Uncharacterized protein n=1 Tax=Mikania micrantha TaxID=192012 RepID=A0A5N6NS09_9ASTR|nr:hypothetical protein E3N88_19941 [Mikania micrantha]
MNPSIRGCNPLISPHDRPPDIPKSHLEVSGVENQQIVCPAQEGCGVPSEPNKNQDQIDPNGVETSYIKVDCNHMRMEPNPGDEPNVPTSTNKSRLNASNKKGANPVRIQGYRGIRWENKHISYPSKPGTFVCSNSGQMDTTTVGEILMTPAEIDGQMGSPMQHDGLPEHLQPLAMQQEKDKGKGIMADQTHGNMNGDKAKPIEIEGEQFIQVGRKNRSHGENAKRGIEMGHLSANKGQAHNQPQAANSNPTNPKQKTKGMGFDFSRALRGAAIMPKPSQKGKVNDLVQATPTKGFNVAIHNMFEGLDAAAMDLDGNVEEPTHSPTPTILSTEPTNVIHGVPDSKKKAILNALKSKSKAVKAKDMSKWSVGEWLYFVEQTRILKVDKTYAVEDVEEEDNCMASFMFFGLAAAGGWQAAWGEPGCWSVMWVTCWSGSTGMRGLGFDLGCLGEGMLMGDDGGLLKCQGVQLVVPIWLGAGAACGCSVPMMAWLAWPARMQDGSSYCLGLWRRLWVAWALVFCCRRRAGYKGTNGKNLAGNWEHMQNTQSVRLMGTVGRRNGTQGTRCTTTKRVEGQHMKGTYMVWEYGGNTTITKIHRMVGDGTQYGCMGCGTYTYTQWLHGARREWERDRGFQKNHERLMGKVGWGAGTHFTHCTTIKSDVAYRLRAGVTISQFREMHLGGTWSCTHCTLLSPEDKYITWLHATWKGWEWGIGFHMNLVSIRGMVGWRVGTPYTHNTTKKRDLSKYWIARVQQTFGKHHEGGEPVGREGDGTLITRSTTFKSDEINIMRDKRVTQLIRELTKGGDRGGGLWFKELEQYTEMDLQNLSTFDIWAVKGTVRDRESSTKWKISNGMLWFAWEIIGHGFCMAILGKTHWTWPVMGQKGQLMEDRNLQAPQSGMKDTKLRGRNEASRRWRRIWVIGKVLDLLLVEAIYVGQRGMAIMVGQSGSTDFAAFEGKRGSIDTPPSCRYEDKGISSRSKGYGGFPTEFEPPGG